MGAFGSFKGLHGPSDTTRVSSTIFDQLLVITLGLRLNRLVNEENWYSYHSTARHLEPHARFVRPACIHSKATDTTPANTTQSLEEPQLALYVSICNVYACMY